jgi:hypothetical protein
MDRFTGHLEVAYSREMVEAYWLCAGGTVPAADCALRDGVGWLQHQRRLSSRLPRTTVRALS